MLQESHRAGHKEFDFSIGYEPYKRFFATHVRAIAPLGTAPIRYRLQSMVKEILRDTLRVYEKAKALGGAFQRAVSRVRSN